MRAYGWRQAREECRKWSRRREDSREVATGSEMFSVAGHKVQGQEGSWEGWQD